MCLGVPGQVIDRSETGDLLFGTVDLDGVRRSVCLACVPDVRPGEFVLVHAGIALTRLDAEEAARALEALRAVGETRPGEEDDALPG